MWKTIIYLGVIVGLLCTLLVCINSTGEFSHFHMNFKKNNELSPETKGDINIEAEEIYVEAEYTEIAGVRTQKERVLVSTFISHNREIDMNITLELFNIWLRVVQESGQDADPSIQFEYFIDDEHIYSRGEAFNDPGNEEIIEIIATMDREIFVAESSEFKVEVYYDGYEDILVFYDNATYNSGFKIYSEASFILDARFLSKKIIVEVFDIFNTDFHEVSAFFSLYVNDIPMNISDRKIEEEVEREFNNESILASSITLIPTGTIGEDSNVILKIQYSIADPDEEIGIIIEGTINDNGGGNGKFLPGFHVLYAIFALLFATIITNKGTKIRNIGLHPF